MSPSCLSRDHSHSALKAATARSGVCLLRMTVEVSNGAVFAPDGRVGIPFRTQACHTVVTRSYSHTGEVALGS